MSIKTQKHQFLALSLLCIGINLTSCREEETTYSDNQQYSKPTTLSSKVNSGNSAIKPYDNFFDGLDWSFTNTPQAPATIGSYNVCQISENNRWGKLSWNWGTCPIDPDLVSSNQGFVELEVPGNQQKRGAQIQTIRDDYSFGSYRARIKAGEHWENYSQGTVNGFFYYNTITEEEIDVEILPREHNSKLVHFTTHPGNHSISYTLNSDPTKNYIEYGFDWYENKVDFVVNGIKVGTQTNAVPKNKGLLIFNNWTGNPRWGGLPPYIKSSMSIDYIWHSPFILVTYPNEANIIFNKGNNHPITWNRYGDVAYNNVDIELWKNDSLYQVIGSNIPNTGNYSWNIPGSIESGDDYYIKVKSHSNNKYFDMSNLGFSIQ